MCMDVGVWCADLLALVLVLLLLTTRRLRLGTLLHNPPKNASQVTHTRLALLMSMYTPINPSKPHHRFRIDTKRLDQPLQEEPGTKVYVCLCVCVCMCVNLMCRTLALSSATLARALASSSFRF
jgi:hypothetical protein